MDVNNILKSLEELNNVELSIVKQKIVEIRRRGVVNRNISQMRLVLRNGIKIVWSLIIRIYQGNFNSKLTED